MPGGRESMAAAILADGDRGTPKTPDPDSRLLISEFDVIAKSIILLARFNRPSAVVLVVGSDTVK